MNKVINVKNVYLLVIIVLGLIGLTTYSTYALFNDSIETDELVSISAINLNINVDNFKSYNQLDLKPYEKKSILVKLSNSTNELNYYKLWYQMINPNKNNDLIKVNKIITSLNNTSGTINAGNTLEIELVVINYTNKEISLNLGVETSLNNKIELDDNKYEILDVEEDDSTLIWSTENNDFEIGKCTKFSTKNKPSGIYKIELWNSINKYVSGSLYLDNNKELYVCVDKKDSSNKISQVSIDIPNKEWYYTSDYNNKILMLNDKESFALSKNKYNELIDINDNYSIDNAKDYYLENISYDNDNNVDLTNGGFAKITLVLPHNNIKNNLEIEKIYIDGKLSSYPTNGEYYLKNYDCNSIDTNLVWNNSNYTISSNNINANEKCDIYLSTTKKLLSSAKQGDYVKYIAKGGIISDKEVKCSGTECTADVKVCGDNNYNNFGWRIAYITNDGNNLVPYLISSSITDCVTSDNNLNDLSIKYCNELYVYGNNCNKDVGSVNTWIFNTKDYEKILSNGYDVNNCKDLNYIDNSCGYNNNLINIGGNYSLFEGSKMLGFNKTNNGLTIENNDIYGLRVVIKLDPNVKVMSGTGLSNDPYVICNKEDCE